MRLSQTAPGEPLGVSGELNLYAAQELLDRFRILLDQEPAPAIDLTGVEACDVSALQILISARRTAESSGRKLRLVGWPEAVDEACRSLGVPVNLVQP